VDHKPLTFAVSGSTYAHYLARRGSAQGEERMNFSFEQKQPVLTLDVMDDTSFGYFPEMPPGFHGVLRMHRGFESITTTITRAELKELADTFTAIFVKSVAADEAWLALPYDEKVRISREKNAEMFGEDLKEQKPDTTNEGE
jgi:hypothetical protein